MSRKFHFLFLFTILLTVFYQTPLIQAQTISSGTVSFDSSWIESYPENGETYRGTRKLFPAEGSATKQLIKGQEWDPSEPADVITYTLKSRVTGQGAIHLSISGQTTRQYDIGSFRPNDVRPTTLLVLTDIERRKVDKYTNLRSYDPNTYVPSENDTCFNVQDKGYNTEIRGGTENLSATGIVSSSKIKVVYGTEKQVKGEFNIGGGGWPPTLNANQGWGTSNTEKWLWELTDDDRNISTPDSLNGSFHVELDDNTESASGERPDLSECAECPICKRPVDNVDDHFNRNCDMFFGCGLPIYHCTEIMKQIQEDWHRMRTCMNSILGGPCRLPFKHCKQTNCYSRWRIWRGHSDGSVPEAPSGVTNLYAESHFVDDPPAIAACGIHDTSVSGDHSSTWLCNVSPCSNRQVPYCFDQCSEADTHGKVVCTISGCQDSTPYDPTSSSAGWHAPCNECSQYRCKGGGHSWYPSCTDTTHTNANGDSCTVAGYECVSHTPVYPSSNNGNNENNGGTMVTCDNCANPYDSSDPATVTSHTYLYICFGCHFWVSDCSLPWHQCD